MTLALWLAATGAATAQSAPDASATVEGRVQILKRRVFGGVKPAREHGGALVFVSGFQRPTPEAAAELLQRERTFRPRVLPVVAGQRVLFPNQDDIYHNVFSVSPLRRFDLGHYKQGEDPGEVVFDRTGLVPVYCNIHPEMIAYVMVLENDAYTFSEESGRFRIEGLPPGELRIEAWMPGASRVTQPLALAPGETVAVEIEVQQVEKLKAHRRKDGTRYPPPRTDEYDE